MPFLYQKVFTNFQHLLTWAWPPFLPFFWPKSGSFFSFLMYNFDVFGFVYVSQKRLMYMKSFKGIVKSLVGSTVRAAWLDSWCWWWLSRRLTNGPTNCFWLGTIRWNLPIEPDSRPELGDGWDRQMHGGESAMDGGGGHLMVMVVVVIFVHLMVMMVVVVVVILAPWWWWWWW